MEKYPPLPIDTEAWLLDTAHLSRFAQGLYFNLLMLMWRTPGCRVPNEISWIERKMAVADDEAATLKSIIKEFCQSDGNWITQKRLRQEYDNMQRFSRFQSDNAKRKWHKEKNICPRAGASEKTAEEKSVPRKSLKTKDATPSPRGGIARATRARLPSPSIPTEPSLPYPDAPESRDRPPPDDFFGLNEDEPKKPADQRELVEQAAADYNAFAVANSLPRCKNLDETRRRKLKLRLAEIGGIEGWREVLSTVRDTPFLRGDNDKGWRCDIDFLLQPKSLNRVREGFYSKGSAVPTPSEHPAQLTNGHVWVDKSSDAGRAWDQHLKATTGKTAPKDQRGGWYMPTLWPPGFQGKADG